MPVALTIEAVVLDIPADANLVLGHAHFIKTAEDLYETVVNSVPQARFGVAFAEASGPRLVRSEGNDETLKAAAARELMKIGCGHTFLLFIRDAFPINLLRDVRACVEVAGIYCATANPVTVVVARDGERGGVLGIMDGSGPLGIENADEAAARRAFVRKIGYKLS